MEKFRLYDNIICIDLKSFYASVECIYRNENPFTYDLVVADTSRGKASIVLAVSPSLKNKGVPGRLRLFELPKDPKICIAKPKMAYYIHVSNQILKMYLEYFSSEDILVYSIDEVFIDVTSYLNLYNKSVNDIAQMLLLELRKRFKLPAVCGIGSNMLLAKFALDIEAKHNSNFIAKWDYDDLEKKLWPITNLQSVWGIGRGNEKRLHKLGIKSMYDLANYDIYKLVKEFGIMGEELYLHAHGIDVSKIQDQEKMHKRKGYSINHTLYKNTPKDQARQLISELVLQLCYRLRKDNKITKTVALHIRYERDSLENKFVKQHKLDNPTLDFKQLNSIILNIYDDDVLDIKIRQIGVSFTNISDFSGQQLNLFTPVHERVDVDLDYAYDKVNAKYGANTIFKASALDKNSQYISRSKLIGGHNAR